MALAPAGVSIYRAMWIAKSKVDKPVSDHDKKLGAVRMYIFAQHPARKGDWLVP